MAPLFFLATVCQTIVNLAFSLEFGQFNKLVAYKLRFLGVCCSEPKLIHAVFETRISTQSEASFIHTIQFGRA